MTFPQLVGEYEATRKVYESTKLTFLGVDGYDVYNCSIPFTWEGKVYIYGRVELRDEWARSRVMLFEKTKSGSDVWQRVSGHIFYLEDPFISYIHGNMVLGGTLVLYNGGQLHEYYGSFYKGSDLSDLRHFTSGPLNMKDIRLVELADGRIGVFSRPRSEEVRKLHGSASVIGFAVVDDLCQVTRAVIDNAEVIPGLLGDDEWGGVNQAYLLDSGVLGIIGHRSYTDKVSGEGEQAVYVNVAFTFDPVTHTAGETRVIGTRGCYPQGPAKIPSLANCAFTSGIVMRSDGKCDLYSGIGDTAEGRIVIDYPFEGFGAIVSRFGR